MQLKPSTGLQGDYFGLKHECVDLVPVAPRAERAFLTIVELEAMRTKRPAVPASRHALETICGASCEIGAH